MEVYEDFTQKKKEREIGRHMSCSKWGRALQLPAVCSFSLFWNGQDLTAHRTLYLTLYGMETYHIPSLSIRKKKKHFQEGQTDNMQFLDLMAFEFCLNFFFFLESL